MQRSAATSAVIIPNVHAAPSERDVRFTLILIKGTLMENPLDKINPETLRIIKETQKVADQYRKAHEQIDNNAINQVRKALENNGQDRIDKILKATEPIRKLNIDFNRLRQEREIIDKFYQNQEILNQLKLEKSLPLYSPKSNSSKLSDMQYEQQSAAHLIARLQSRYESWSQELAEDLQPVIYAITGGVVLRVETLTEESYHGIAIEGLMTNTGTPGLLIAHQASLQLLCVAEQITLEKPKRQIGFFYSSTDTE